MQIRQIASLGFNNSKSQSLYDFWSFGCKLYIVLYVLPQKEATMAISASDVIPLSHARANFSELAEDVRAGAEKIITKNGEAFIAIIDAKRLDYYHQLERERIHLLLIDEASKGLDDVAAGRVKDARTALQAIKSRLSSATSAPASA
jgi:prevent-host-death family protein